MIKEYFSHDVDALSDIKIVKMMQDYDFTGFGWYWAIVAELCKNGGQYEFNDLGIMAKCVGIKRENLANFIDKCIHNYTYKEKGLFNCDETSFWSDSLLKRMEIRNKRRDAAKQNQKDDSPRKKLSEIELVNLTETQYEKLVAKYGENITNKAIEELERWLLIGGTPTAKQARNKNHYAYFKFNNWPIANAKKALGVDTKPNWSI